MSAAVDSTAGERERRSLEVLMSQPAEAWELVLGKWFAAASLSLIGVTFGLLLAHGILTWLPLEEIGMSWRVTTADLARVCLASIPLSLFAAAIQIAVAMNAKSFKEAQSTLSFLMLLPLLPGVVVSMMELKTALWMYLVPIPVEPDPAARDRQGRGHRLAALRADVLQLAAAGARRGRLRQLAHEERALRAGRVEITISRSKPGSDPAGSDPF